VGPAADEGSWLRRCCGLWLLTTHPVHGKLVEVTNVT